MFRQQVSVLAGTELRKTQTNVGELEWYMQSCSGTRVVEERGFRAAMCSISEMSMRPVMDDDGHVLGHLLSLNTVTTTTFCGRFGVDVSCRDDSSAAAAYNSPELSV